MANALDAVLKIKADEQQRQEFQSQQITAAVDLLQRARQNAQQNQLAQLQAAQNAQQLAQQAKYQDATIANQGIDNTRQQELLDLQKKQFGLDILQGNIKNRQDKRKELVDLAKSGLKINPDGSIVRDESLASPLDQLLTQGKAADAQLKIIEAGGQSPNIFGGNNSSVPSDSTIGKVIGKPAVSGGVSSSGQGIISGQTLNAAGVPTNTKIEYPASDIAKTLATETGKAKAEGQKAVARDTAVFTMIGGIMGDLMDIYDVADKAGYAGDIYKAGIGDVIATGKVPTFVTDKMNVDPKGVEAVSSFVARRNELMTRMQPLLSEQFGKEGSSRIMESLLKLTDKELAQLSDPRAAAVGKSIATLENFYRFAKASQDYADKIDLTTSGKTDNFVEKVLDNSSGKLSTEEKKYFKDIRDKYMGIKNSNDLTYSDAKKEAEYQAWKASQK